MSQRLGVRHDLTDDVVAQRHRGQGAGGVARVDPGLLDVLQYSSDIELVAVEDRIAIDLDRPLEETIDEHGPKSLSVLGAVDRIDRGPEDPHSGPRQGAGEMEWGLTSQLHDDADRAFSFDDVHYVFEVKGLEVEAVG